jgi:glyoxylase-like metal-dependent hydrolase (beta-lactamase superfamily II)
LWQLPDRGCPAVATPITVALQYEFRDTPDKGDSMNVLAGLKWLRMPLPFRLGHINLWLLKNNDGWTIVDTGIYSGKTRETWEAFFTQQLNGAAIRRVIVTHLHPDHAGCAGWLTQRHGVDLWMTREEYLLCRLLRTDSGPEARDEADRFYSRAGLSSEDLEHYRTLHGFFGKLVAPLPLSFHRLTDGMKFRIGQFEWRVIVGRGHSPEHACLYCPKLNILISGDQVLPTISPNVSVYPTKPDANPLADWFTSLKHLREMVPADVLVLPSHGRPFRGLHERLDQLEAEHETGLHNLRALCRSPQRAIDVFPALFKSRIDTDALIMATGEALAHLNYLDQAGALSSQLDDRGVCWYSC